MKRLSAWMFILPFVTALSGAGCGAVRNLNMYSTSEEVQLGQNLNREIHKQYDILDDQYLDEFVGERGRKLLEAARNRDIEYHFYVVKDEVVNAFAIPGGYCYVNLGLMRQSDDEAELVSVIAHEISHVTNRHSMKRLTQMNIVGALSQVVLGDAGTLERTVANLFTSTGMLYYSREAEREADHDGLVMMYDAGYDPLGMVRMFQRLQEKQGGEQDPNWTNLFSTHPMTGERIQNAKDLIAKLPGKEGLIMNSAQWDEVKGYIAEKYPPPEKEEPAGEEN